MNQIEVERELESLARISNRVGHIMKNKCPTFDVLMKYKAPFSSSSFIYTSTPPLHRELNRDND